MSDLSRLRAIAARTDAEFAVKQFNAERELAAARYRRSIANLNAMLMFPEPKPAPSICKCCSEWMVERRQS